MRFPTLNNVNKFLLNLIMFFINLFELLILEAFLIEIERYSSINFDYFDLLIHEDTLILIPDCLLVLLELFL